MRPTAETVVKPYQLSGKVAVTTGGNTGIGFETAKALVGAGCHVILTSRSQETGNSAATALNAADKVSSILMLFASSRANGRAWVRAGQS